MTKREPLRLVHILLVVFPWVLAAFIVSACDESLPMAPSNPTAPSGFVTISGQVIDFRTGGFVLGAVVRLEGVNVDAVEAVANSSGVYVISVLVGQHRVFVNGVVSGSAYVNGSAYRGDLLIDHDYQSRDGHGLCIGRHGIILDARTLRPIGAMVANGLATSGADGWYRIDRDCPAFPSVGTQVWTVTHPDYEPGIAASGRGILRVLRSDVALTRK